MKVVAAGQSVGCVTPPVIVNRHTCEYKDSLCFMCKRQEDECWLSNIEKEI